MQYLTEIREFYNWLECNPISTSAICLWHALMNVANKTGWLEWFTVPIATLELKTGLSRRDVYRARNILKQAGRVEFKERSGSQCSVYKVIPFVCQYDTQSDTQCVTQPVTQVDTQCVTQSALLNRPDKTRPDKTSNTSSSSMVNNGLPPFIISPQAEPAKKSTRFTPPTVEEVRAYCRERGNRVNPENFVDFYISNGWKVGKNPMKDWKAAVRTWERNESNKPSQTSQPKPKIFRAADYLGDKAGEFL